MKNNPVKIFVFAAFLFSISTFADQILPMKVRPAGQTYQVAEMEEGRLQKDQARGVQYLTEEQRDQDRLIIKDGWVYDRSGIPVEDTKNETPGHKDRINYVMDANGNFYLFDEYKFPKIRHSSIFSGKAVAGAGEISIKNGHIVHIDAESGHYPACKKLIKNVLNELQSDGVDLSAMTIDAD